MKIVFLLAVLATGLIASAAWAAQPISIRANTAGDLAEDCGVNPREPAADAKLNFCVGFAQGAIDVELHYAGDKKPFCIPKPGPTREATMSEFASWVRAIPERRSMAAAPGLFKFLRERFPCS
jgi:Rap1a immunity proteins